MHFKNLTFILLFICSATVYGQRINFKVIDVNSNQPVAGVKVTSLPEHRFIIYSDDKGTFSEFVTLNDTIELTKEGYHNLLLKIRTSNFDSTHFVVVGMISSNVQNKKVPIAYNNLENFEYHFVHDTLGDQSTMKINVLENVQAVRQRSKSRDQSFKIGAVNIDSPPSLSDPNKTYKSHYRLIK